MWIIRLFSLFDCMILSLLLSHLSYTHLSVTSWRLEEMLCWALLFYFCTDPVSLIFWSANLSHLDLLLLITFCSLHWWGRDFPPRITEVAKHMKPNTGYVRLTVVMHADTISHIHLEPSGGQHSTQHGLHQGGTQGQCEQLETLGDRLWSAKGCGHLSYCMRLWLACLIIPWAVRKLKTTTQR